MKLSSFRTLGRLASMALLLPKVMDAASPAAPAAASAETARPPDIGPAAIIREIDLPSEARPGEQRHGLTYQVRSHYGFLDTGWARPATEGAIKYWYDDNGNGQREPGEVLARPVYFRLAVPEAAVRFDDEAANRAAIEALRQRDARYRMVAVGDSAVAARADDGTWTVEAMRGPLRISLRLRCTAFVAGEPRLHPGNDRLSYARYNTPDELKKTKSSEGNQKWRAEEVDQTANAFRAAAAGAGEAALEVARSMVRAWDTWSNRRPVATAPGLKGTYNPDMSPYWPRPNELPAGIVAKAGSRLPEGRNASVYLNLASADGKHSYDVQITCHPFRREDLEADAPVRFAHADFEQRSTSDFLQNEEYHPVRKPLELAGADEAVEVALPFISSITFRAVNVVVVVRGRGGDINHPQTFASEAIAKLILAKLLNDRANLPEVRAADFALREKNPNADLVVDGRTAKILVARCRTADGRPAAGVRVNLSVDDSRLPARGRLSARSVITGAEGEAEFTYTPPAVSAGTTFESTRIAIRAACSLGSPAEPFSDELVLPVGPGYEQKFKVEFTAAQVLDVPVCPYWVAGKPALLRTRLDWINPAVTEIEARVTYSWAGRVLTTKPFTFKRDYTPRERVRRADTCYATFLVDAPARANELEVKVEPVKIQSWPGLRHFARPATAKLHVEMATPTATVRIRFTPIGVGSWKGRERIDAAEFKRLRETQMEYLRAILPLPPERVLDVTNSDLVMEVNEAAIESNTWIQMVTDLPKCGAVLARLQMLHNLRPNPGTYDFEVGVAPVDWMPDLGIEHPWARNALLVSAVAYDSILAHEVGHGLGLPHTVWEGLSNDPGAQLAGLSLDDMYQNERTHAGTDLMSALPRAGGVHGAWASRHTYTHFLRQLTQLP